MNKDKIENLKDTGKGLLMDTVLDVGSEMTVEVLKNSTMSLLGDLTIDVIGSAVPGISGAIQGYKRVRFEKNIRTFIKEFYSEIDEIRTNLETKSEEQKKKIDELFGYVIDYVIDEQQEEKIHYMVNGFINITSHEQISDDFVLTYYDVLRELRMIDVSVLNLYNKPFSYNENSNETFQDILDKFGIRYEQYHSVQRNLQRIGLLTTKTDLNVTEDLDEIAKSFKNLYVYLDKLTDPKYKQNLPKLKLPKLKSKEKLQLSKFGKDFTSFFINKQ